MDDHAIVALYWQRNEAAITATAAKYGKYCFAIAYGVLGNENDAEESVNDTYLDAWNAMPPSRPLVLATFLGKITRRISIDRWRRRNAGKRGSGQMEAVLDELTDCIASGDNVAETVEQQMIAERINAFVKSLPDAEQRIILCRYFYMDSIEDIAKRFGFSQSKIKSMMLRTRKKLRAFLEKEGLL